VKKLSLAALVLFVLFLATPVCAQERFKQVWVTQSDSGEILRGRLVDLSHDSLALLTPDNRRVEVPLDRVLRIETHGDSLKNGAVMGAVVMGGLVALACRGFEGGGQCATAVAIDAGLGALVGAGVDALNGGRTAIYTRPAPVPAGKTAALRFTVRF
jgi:hypothetical protein